MFSRASAEAADLRRGQYQHQHRRHDEQQQQQQQQSDEYDDEEEEERSAAAAVNGGSSREGAAGHKRQRSSGADADGAASPSAASSSRNGEDASKKLRRTGPGSRGVANLTPEQLAKKRANDRDAQRAIRERTKQQIENLEKKIHELTSQQPYQELQAVVRAKEAVEAENANLKKHLAWIVSTLQPLIAGPQGPPSESRVYPSPAQSFLPVHTTAAPPLPPPPASIHQGSTPGSAASPGNLEPPSQWQQGASTSGTTAVQTPNPGQTHLLGQQRHDLLHGLELGAERLGLDFLLDASQQVAKIHTGRNGAQDSPEYHHAPMRHDASLAYAGSSASPPDSIHAQPSDNYASAAAKQAGGSEAGLPRWALPLNNCPATCPLDSLLLDFLSERRQRAAEGLSAVEIVGPRYPSVSSLLNPQNSRFSHPLSKVFTDILATFPDLSALPERVAVLYVMFLIMRWQIAPTRENYDRLPPWARPGPAQHLTPHPAWVDNIPFPPMRERLVRDYAAGSFSPELFDDFFVPFTMTLSLSWPYEPTDALLRSPGEGGDQLMINPVFERHLRRLENWTLGEAFLKALPGLEGTFNLEGEGGGGRTSRGRSNSGRNGGGGGGMKKR